MEKSVKYKRIVVKVGSSTLTHDNNRLNLRRLEALTRTLSELKNSGCDVILVSSAAISAGTAKLGLSERPRTTMEKQAVAAVGQTELMKVYSHFFDMFGHSVGQILLTRDEIERKIAYENAENTFNTLLSMSCIPIVNENDSMSYAEIEFGDNDTLSAYVAKICRADVLIILSDIDGLYTDNPRENPSATLIPRVSEITDKIRSFAGGAGTNRGTGGLATKIKAAELVTSAGIPMYIVNGENPEIIYDITDGKQCGTYFEANSDNGKSTGVL